MAEFWNYIKGLFQSGEESTPSQPALHELIERDAKEKEDYEFWKGTLVRRRLQDWLIDQYAIFRVLPRDIDDSLDFLNTPSSKGFVVHFYKTQYSERDVQHFFDFLKEKVLALDYRTQISDKRVYSRPQWVEKVERHYLKPRPKPNEDGTFRQLFGNVMIELESRNDKAHYLKFRATSYVDRLYEEPGEFKELMQALAN